MTIEGPLYVISYLHLRLYIFLILTIKFDFLFQMVVLFMVLDYTNQKKKVWDKVVLNRGRLKLASQYLIDFSNMIL